MQPEKFMAALSGFFLVTTIVALVANSIKSKRIEKLQTRNWELEDQNKSLYEHNLVLEAQRTVFCKGTVSITLDAQATDPKEIERVTALLVDNMKKLDKRKSRF